MDARDLRLRAGFGQLTLRRRFPRQHDDFILQFHDAQVGLVVVALRAVGAGRLDIRDKRKVWRLRRPHLCTAAWSIWRSSLVVAMNGGTLSTEATRCRLKRR